MSWEVEIDGLKQAMDKKAKKLLGRRPTLGNGADDADGIHGYADHADDLMLMMFMLKLIMMMMIWMISMMLLMVFMVMPMMLIEMMLMMLMVMILMMTMVMMLMMCIVMLVMLRLMRVKLVHWGELEAQVPAQWVGGRGVGGAPCLALQTRRHFPLRPLPQPGVLGGLLAGAGLLVEPAGGGCLPPCP
eukprot:11049075-Lingulodinium_polyedra.AAC.1